MKISLVIGSLGLGGTETQVCRLARELRDRGHEVKLFVLFVGGPLTDQLKEDKIDFEIFGSTGFENQERGRGITLNKLTEGFKATWRFWRSLWRFQPDVCHAFLPHAYFLAMPGAALGGVPVRVTARRGLSSKLNFSLPFRILQNLSNWCSNVVVANSNLVLNDVSTTETSLPRLSAVIPNGVDLPSELSDVGVEPPRGLVVANLIVYKGHEDLIIALSSIDAPPLITFVGDGPDRRRLEKLVTDRGLDKTISFAGPQIEARQLFHDVQFAVQPSHQEGMPNTVLEAMSYGVPVIATSVGGIPELIEDGITGLLVSSHAPDEIAIALIRLRDNPDLRRRLGLKGREKAAEFSWDLCAERHINLYFDLLEDHRLKSSLRTRVKRFFKPDPNIPTPTNDSPSPN